MQSYVLGALLALAAAPALAQQTAAEVYQWTDANGVTHYSQTPPSAGRYEQRSITSAGTTAPAPKAEADAADENPQCTSARANITALQAEGDVQIDEDGSGTLRVLTAEQRANQLELAQAAVKAYCTP